MIVRGGNFRVSGRTGLLFGSNQSFLFTVVFCLTTGICSEEFIVGSFCCGANNTECIYTKLDSMAYSTPRLDGVPPPYARSVLTETSLCVHDYSECTGLFKNDIK